jgi:hypothetical protein
MSQDWRLHCGPDGFSPQAPPELCALLVNPPEEVHHVPEPSALVLVLVALVLLALRRRI